MVRTILVSALMSLLGLQFSATWAWWDAGHMQIAYVAYKPQLKLMIAALPASYGASDDVRSYDLVWVLHLVGDAHQPLHAVARFTASIPNGDAGGNAESVIPATGETIALHDYWDRIFGAYSSPYGAVFDADAKDGIADIAVNKIAAEVQTRKPGSRKAPNSRSKSPTRHP